MRFAGATLVLLIATLPVQAQQRLQCDTGNIVDESFFGDFTSSKSEAIRLEAGGIEVQLGDKPSARMSGGILLQQGERLAGADSASYNSESMTLELIGNVRFQDPGKQIRSDTAELSYSSGRIHFEGAQFKLAGNGARGAASEIEVNRQGEISLNEVYYTTCPPGSNDWQLAAGDIDLNPAEGVGSAKHVRLKFQGVPILYAPYLSFPVGEARKSGILTPELGSAGRSGRALSIPYYWNIAPNYDATFTPRYLTDRGLQLQTQFRYLTNIHDGVLKFDYLSSDDQTGSNRQLLDVKHRTRFSSGLRNLIDYRDVSDSGYFEDLGGTLSISSITHLNRSVQFDYYTDAWSIIGKFQEFQTIDEAILPTEEPYRRLPQILIQGFWPDRAFGLHYGLNSELVYFDRDVGVTGWRLDAAPIIERPIENPGWFITPAVMLEYTRYQLTDRGPDQPQDPSRTIPIASMDTGMVLERQMRSAHGLVQTLEPRVLYVHIPYREQSELPVFDTIVPDLNLVQLYRKNRFLGADRIVDTDQLSIGVTSRILDESTGQEIFTATIGQALYLSSQGVTLPDQTTSFGDSSDYIAEVGFPLYQSLKFDLGYQWGSGGRGTTQSEARVQYRPQTNKVLNLSYRFRKESLEQGDVSWSWPVARRWNFVGRYNFSFRDNETLERFFGIEYESCCWALRVVTRRHISTRDGTRDSSFGLQLVLKGMTAVGTRADKLLENGILGYSSDLY